ncbi:MAG: nucleoside-diphosphate sugar epimerase/dehydratase [Actinomycetes bacterium]
MGDLLAEPAEADLHTITAESAPSMAAARPRVALATSTGRLASSTLRLAQMGVDSLAYLTAAVFAIWLRLEFSPGVMLLWGALLLGAVMAMGQIVVGTTLGLYRGRYRYGSFDEVFGVLSTMFVVATGTWIALLLSQTTALPRSTAIATAVVAFIGMLASRFLVRWWRTHRLQSLHTQATIVIGAGENGERLVSAMTRDDGSDYQPVAFLDDDHNKRNLRMHGVPIMGRTSDLAAVLNRTGAKIVIVAIARVEASQLLEFNTVCKTAGAKLRVLPSVADIAGGAVTLGDVSDVSDEDLLGRRSIDTDEEGIAEMITGRTVLITGAGGSIGSELARQVHRYSPARLVLLDRDESALHQVQLSIDGRALLDTDDLVLADIRDDQRMREVFAQVQPDIVMHAAALKHMPMLERAPLEAYKTNVLGTAAVLQEAARWRVPTVVNISTDKAANPENVLGYSKRITERLTFGAAPPESHWVSVRFGNVLGSRGSVLTAFRAQIAAGGPVTVTDPEITRFFMTVSEAVHLVLQAVALGDARGVLVLDMGEPMRIDDVARQLIASSGRDIRIEYTGLRRGEKLHEVLFDSCENPTTTEHPLIFEVGSCELSPHDLPHADSDSEALEALMLLSTPGNTVNSFYTQDPST